MEIGNIIPHIEALIFASDRPLTAIDITELINNAFGFMEDKITMDQVESSLEGIVEKYRSEFYPFEVRESGGGWQFLTKKDFHKTVAQLNGEKFLKRLSNAALETLAIIAYKQPVTKSDIESIRGVSSDYSIQKLLEKELIVITGRNEELPGKPLVYETSKTFMDYFGLNSAEDLPKLKEIFDDAMVNPTNMQQGERPEEQAHVAGGDETLVVKENGELAVSRDPEETDGPDPVAENTNPDNEEQKEDVENAGQTDVADEIILEGSDDMAQGEDENDDEDTDDSHLPDGDQEAGSATPSDEDKID